MIDHHFIVGVPTYNRSHLVDRIYQSLIAQNHLKWTLVFIDDHSLDNTDEVLSTLKEKDIRVRSERMKTNSGVNKVRNRIVDVAKKIDPEAYLVFIDDDDCLALNCLELLNKEIIENPGYGWYTLDCSFPSGEKITRMKRYGELSYLRDYMFGKVIRGDLTHVLFLQTVKEDRFTEEFKNAEEWYFWCNLSYRLPLFAINAVGSIKEYLPEGITQSGMNRDKAIQVLEFKIKSLEPIVEESELLHQYVTLVKLYLKKNNGDTKKPRELLRKVFKLSPLYFRQYKYWIKMLYM